MDIAIKLGEYHWVSRKIVKYLTNYGKLFHTLRFTNKTVMECYFSFGKASVADKSSVIVDVLAKNGKAIKYLAQF